MQQYGTIEQEARNCLRRFRRAGTGVGDLVLFFHHEQAVEALLGPFEERITSIQREKDEEERAIRLHWFRPIPKEMMKGLPSQFIVACEQYGAACEQYRATWAQYRAAWERRRAALEQHETAAAWAHEATRKQYRAACEQHEAALEQYKAAREQHEADRQQFRAAWEQYAPEVNALIKKYFPGCPWNGRTLFPRRGERKRRKKCQNH